MERSVSTAIARLRRAELVKFFGAFAAFTETPAFNLHSELSGLIGEMDAMLVDASKRPGPGPRRAEDE